MSISQPSLKLDADRILIYFMNSVRTISDLHRRVMYIGSEEAYRRFWCFVAFSVRKIRRLRERQTRMMDFCISCIFPLEFSSIMFDLYLLCVCVCVFFCPPVN